MSAEDDRKAIVESLTIPVLDRLAERLASDDVVDADGKPEPPARDRQAGAGQPGG